MPENLVLTKLSPLYRAAMLEMIADYQSAGERRYDAIRELILTDFAAYLRKLEDNERGINLPPEFSPDSVYFLLKDGKTFLGSLRLRHKLVPDLMVEGGNIGYDIRPSQRRKGYATQMLRLGLEKAREIGLQRVLITCDETNIASARVIEKNGGILENRLPSPDRGVPISRYWIEIS